ncbi:MAG TPA: alpha/beta hydrolase [bacterium]|nr:alpha/beta hydrolase [bacterium]
MERNGLSRWPLPAILAVLVCVFCSCDTLPGGSIRDTDNDGIANADDACPTAPFKTRTVYFSPLTKSPLNPGSTDLMLVPDPTSPTGRRVHMVKEDFPLDLDLGDLGDILPPEVLDMIFNILPYSFNQLDGLSATSDIMIYLSAPPAASAANPRTVMMVNVDPKSGHYLESAPLEINVETLPADTVNPERYRLRLRPAEPLYSRSQYLVIVTDGLKTGCGESFTASPDMAALRSGEPASGPLSALWNEYRPYIGLAENKLRIERRRISLLFSYSTQSVSEDLVAIREAAVSAPPPPVTIIDYFAPLTPAGEINWARLDPWLPELPDDALITPGYFTNVALLVFGSFPSPSYLNHEKVFELDPATFKPIEFDSEDLMFLLALPQKAQYGPVPVVVFGHALGVCKETLLAISDTFARHGFATMGIDVLGHGSRSQSGMECGQGGDMADMILPLIYLEINGSTIEGNLLSIREIFRQSVADEINFVRMIKGLTAADLDLMPIHGNTMGDGVLDLDASHLSFCSQSLGSVLGGTLVGVEPGLEASVLNVGGGYFSDFMSAFLGDLSGLLSGDFLAGVQMVMDGADPVNYARAITREPFPGLSGARTRNILFQEAVNDDTVPNETTELLARVARAGLVWPYVKPVPGLVVNDAPVTANLSPSVTAGLYQFHPVEHEFLLLPDNPAATVAAQEQAAIFFSTAQSSRTGAATIINTMYPTGPPPFP